ncbi:TetR/AcrR family transcriptional regulator [Agromyces sp. SYSU T0242]|uniref:TetR/AcrR family transcriptional regulator n=1 Tax=Agromyces litoreus TaxID=3158561 RepID=UPI003399CC1B
MDVRVERTRRALQEALFALARERPLEAVTIADLVARAGVNRSSFYQHYSDKETLLADALDAAAERAGANLPELDAPLDEPPRALYDYLAHFDENAEIYRRVLGPQGSAVVVSRLRAGIEAVVVDGLARSGTRVSDDLPIDVLAAGIAGSALGVIQSWLARDPRPSVETAADWLWRVLLGPGGAWELPEGGARPARLQG